MCVGCISSVEAVVIGGGGVTGMLNVLRTKYFFRGSGASRVKRDRSIAEANKTFAHELGVDTSYLFHGAAHE